DNGAMSDFTRDLKEILFGTADGSKSADQLGELFARFRDYGKAIREFSDAVTDNPVARFLGEFSGYGVSLFIAGAGFAFAAGAISKLARALYLLSGAKAAVAILTTLARLGGRVFGAAATIAGEAAKPRGGAPKPATKLPRRPITLTPEAP